MESERRFTADASHELRTPLAAIQMQAQVALATPSDDDRRHALEQILAGTRRATALEEQLLRLARLDPLAGLANTQPIELNALASQVLAELGPTAGACQLRLSPANDTDVTVYGDADLLGVALRNLVGNALRHAPAGSEITLGVEQGNGAPQLWVADNGPGVPEEELPYLTDRFYRGRDATTEGSGLGLAIVNRIAELHGANLVLENRPEGGLRAALVWGV
jgi:two-component system sensor histidine kinase QseC